jgi:hypothetical protein
MRRYLHLHLSDHYFFSFLLFSFSFCCLSCFRRNGTRGRACEPQTDRPPTPTTTGRCRYVENLAGRHGWPGRRSNKTKVDRCRETVVPVPSRRGSSPAPASPWPPSVRQGCLPCLLLLSVSAERERGGKPSERGPRREMQLEADRQGRTERSRPNGRAVSFIETPDAGAPVLGTLTTPPQRQEEEEEDLRDQ